MAEKKEKREYRCTRNAPYMHDCIGHDDIGSRQGHYVDGYSVGDAVKEMIRSHPDEIEEGFTIQTNIGLGWDKALVVRWNWLGFDKETM